MRTLESRLDPYESKRERVQRARQAIDAAAFAALAELAYDELTWLLGPSEESYASFVRTEIKRRAKAYDLGKEVS